MKATSIWTKDFQSVVDNGRDHSLIIDLPESKGGENNGPTALELCVMSFSGCVGTIFASMSKKMRISFEKYQIEVFAEQESGAPTITDVHCTLFITTKESKNKIEECLEKAIRNCPVGKLFHQAGVEMTHEIIIL